MDRKLATAKDVAEFLGARLVGPDISIFDICPIHLLKPGRLSFISKLELRDSASDGAVVIVPLNWPQKEGSGNTYIYVANPRLAFAKAVQKFVVSAPKSGISPYAYVDTSAKIAEHVSIGHGTVVCENAEIGSHTIIGHNVVIAGNSRIGSHCYIKSGSVIGEDGFGMDFEADGTPVRIPHVGRVIMGNHVEIGAKNTVARGTLADTVIGDYVKTDDQVHIAHNCVIGANTIITACAELSGSVTVGRQCWLGPNCSIMNKVTLGDNVTVGLGAVITSSVESGQKVMGFEALDIRALVRLKKRLEFPSR